MIRDLSYIDRPAGFDPASLGREPFLLRPGHFAVVDGDTIWALSTSGRGRGERDRMSFSMRFRSIAAPERPMRRATDRVLSKSGVDPYWDHAGRRATDLLKTYMDRRALLVQPTGRIDPYGRMLCDMSVVPYTGRNPDLARAISLERLMLDREVVTPFGREVPPSVRPQIPDTPATLG